MSRGTGGKGRWGRGGSGARGAAARAGSPRCGPARPPRKRRRNWLAGIGSAVVVIMAAVAITLAVTSNGGSPASAARRDTETQAGLAQHARHAEAEASPAQRRGPCTARPRPLRARRRPPRKPASRGSAAAPPASIWGTNTSRTWRRVRRRPPAVPSEVRGPSHPARPASHPLSPRHCSLASHTGRPADHPHRVDRCYGRPRWEAASTSGASRWARTRWARRAAR